VTTRVQGYQGGPTIQLPRKDDSFMHSQVCPPYCGPSGTLQPKPVQPVPLPAPMTPPDGGPATAPNPLSSVSGLLDQQVFGIPVKYLAIGVAVFFMMRK